jgi:tetratricopeptide (TPR) repeat protein
VISALRIFELHAQDRISRSEAASQTFFQEVSTLLYQKEYTKALEYISAEFATDSGTAIFKSRALALKAAALRGKGDIQSALTHYDYALHIETTSQADTSLSVGERQSFRNAVEATLQARLSIFAGTINASNHTDSAVRESSNQAALRDLLRESERVLRDAPDNALALYQHGYALFSMRLYDSAAHDFRRVVGILPPLQAATAYYHLGLCTFFTHHPDEAKFAFSRAIALAPFHAESYFYRGCILARQEKFAAAIEDFTFATQYNPTDAPSMGMLGSLLINSGRKKEGCIRLARAYQLGYAPALPIIERYCDNNVAEDGSKIVRLPTITVDGNKQINYAQRVTTTKQAIYTGLRVRSPMQQPGRKMFQNTSFSEGTLVIPDGNGTAQVALSNNERPASPTSIPLQAILNNADCNGVVVNTQSFVSLQCIAYILRQETKPMDNDDIHKLVKRLQQLADELAVAQNAIGNMNVGNPMNPQAIGGELSSGDFVRLNGMYQDFQELLGKLQKKIEDYEKVLQAEGKIQTKG